MKILYENEDAIFAVKPVGILSEGSGSAVEILSEHCKNNVYCVHRLDRAVSGVMVYAKNRKSAAYISSLISNGEFAKEYYAVICGDIGEGKMEDLLFKDSSKNKSYVVKRERKGVKKAELEYKTLCVEDGLSLVGVTLHTGRSHQIRVQFSSRGFPLLGDGKYGGTGNCNIALFSRRIAYRGPNGKMLSVEAVPNGGYPWNVFEEYFKNSVFE